MEKENSALMWIFCGAIVLLFILGSFGIGSYGVSYGMMGFGMGFGFLFMLLFWGAIIWLIVTLVQTNQSNKNNNEESVEILKRRYAKGEMTKKQFEELKKDLK